MHRDRNNGPWPELKAKRHNKFKHQKFDEGPLRTIDLMNGDLDGAEHDTHKIKREKAAKHLSDVKNMFRNMIDYDDKQNNLT